MTSPTDGPIQEANEADVAEQALDADPVGDDDEGYPHLAEEEDEEAYLDVEDDEEE